MDGGGEKQLGVKRAASIKLGWRQPALTTSIKKEGVLMQNSLESRPVFQVTANRRWLLVPADLQPSQSASPPSEAMLSINSGCLISWARQISPPLPTHSIYYASKCLGASGGRSRRSLVSRKRGSESYSQNVPGLAFLFRWTWSLSDRIYRGRRCKTETAGVKPGWLFIFVARDIDCLSVSKWLLS